MWRLRSQDKREWRGWKEWPEAGDRGGTKKMEGSSKKVVGARSGQKQQKQGDLSGSQGQPVTGLRPETG